MVASHAIQKIGTASQLEEEQARIREEEGVTRQFIIPQPVVLKQPNPQPKNSIAEN
jgi:hypothetical protein